MGCVMLDCFSWITPNRALVMIAAGALLIILAYLIDRYSPD
jgi:hypothetical protein